MAWWAAGRRDVGRCLLVLVPGWVRRRRRLGLVTASVVGTAGLLGVEVIAALRGDYLPDDPGYRIDALVEPASGTRAATGEQPRAPVRLAVLGDSTVAGLGSATAEEALPTLIARRVADTLGRPVHVIGAGVSGARTADVIAVQLPEAVRFRPHVVVAVVGANDVTHLTPPWRLRAQLRLLAGAVRERTGAPLVLGGIPRFKGIAAFAEPLRTVVDTVARVQRRAQRAAARQAGFAFAEIARDASPRFVGVADAMSWDGFHPAAVGYGFWADAIAPEVIGALHRRCAG